METYKQELNPIKKLAAFVTLKELERPEPENSSVRLAVPVSYHAAEPS